MININNKEELKKLGLESLISDAVERKDKGAFNWLKLQAVTNTTRQKANGDIFTVSKPVNLIRSEYLKKYYPEYLKKQRNASTLTSRLAMFEKMEAAFN